MNIEARLQRLEERIEPKGARLLFLRENEDGTYPPLPENIPEGSLIAYYPHKRNIGDPVGYLGNE